MLPAPPCTILVLAEATVLIYEDGSFTLENLTPAAFYKGAGYFARVVREHLAQEESWIQSS